jgi:single-stranded-DNA-specific exonuclease
VTSAGQMAPSRAALSLPPARWEAPPTPDSVVVSRLTEALRLRSEVCALLAVRGHGEPESAKMFLRPLLTQLHDPELLADGPGAADRLVRAVRDGVTMLVHGDYDVDGVCATALLTRYLRGVGARAVPFVPHRLRDGYDFGEAGLRAARDAGARLVVTVDSGTVAYEAVSAARDMGLEVIVIDHHTVGAKAAPADLLVNPQRPDCPYPDKGLCGTGLAFKVCELVGTRLDAPREDLLAMLDLVALASVADLVPLRGENRILVGRGLSRFRDTRIPGLRSLLRTSGVEAAKVTAGQLGFVVAPRLNAAGRIGEAADALQLLLTDDDGEAEVLARRLEEINRARQEEDRRTLNEALDLLTKDFDPHRDYGVVLASEGWHPGVIGIVASRVVERIHRPVVMIALDGASGRGSARSIPGFHLYDALHATRAHLRRFGGHRQAAGMDLDRECIEAFRADFNREARARLREDDLRPVHRPDLELSLEAIDLDLIHWLGYLGPHGIGNPRPTFLVRGVELEGVRTLKDRHLKMSLRSGSTRLDAIGFGLASVHAPDTLGRGRFDALVRLERNEWRGVARPQAHLVALTPTAPAPS